MTLEDFRNDTMELVHEWAGDDHLEVFAFNLDSIIALARAEGRREGQARVEELEKCLGEALGYIVCALPTKGDTVFVQSISKIAGVQPIN